LNNLFFFLLFISFILFGSGLIRPGYVIRWGDPEKRNRKKVFLTYFSLIVISIIGFSMTMDTNRVVKNSSSTQQTNTDSMMKSIIKYEIVDFKVKNRSTFTNYTYKVVVKESANVEQLKEVCKSVLEDAKKKGEFNAVTILLADSPVYFEYSGSTLGKATFSVEGDTSKAKTIKAGEYDKMSFSWELKEKDWATKLSSEELKVWESWMKARKLARDSGLTLPEDNTNEEIAKQFNLTPEQVNAILKKKSIWVNS
jgi:hypothetical protein